MKLKKEHIYYLYFWLNIPLHGEELKARNWFVKLVDKTYEEVLDVRKKKLEEFSDKDKDGKAVLVDGNYQIPDNKKEDYMKSLKEAMQEEIEFEVSKSDNFLKAVFKTVLENKLKPMDLKEGLIWDEVIS